MEEIKTYFITQYPTAIAEENKDYFCYNILVEEWLNVAENLKNNPILFFDFLICITCIDWKTHLSIVYHFRSTKLHHQLCIKVKLENENPQIQSVCHLWQTAEFHEREVFDLMGIQFLNHPDLRRLFLTDEWVGFPLRKNYEDPINMIKL